MTTGQSDPAGWPSPLRLAGVAGLLLALLSFWWPSLAAATLALCSLGAAAGASRATPTVHRRSRRSRAAIRTGAIAFAAACIAFVALPSLFIAFRALAVAGSTVALAILSPRVDTGPT